jgi:hypothetical protein
MYRHYKIGDQALIKNIKNKGVSLVLVALGLATLLGFAALAIDLGSSFNIQNQLQKSTTTAALAGAAAYNSHLLSSENITNIKAATEDTFSLATQYEKGLVNPQIVGNIQVDTDVGAVRLQTKADAPTYFIRIIGIKSLEVNARAAAMSYEVPYIVMNDITVSNPNKKKASIAFAESKDSKITGMPEGTNLDGGKKVQLVGTLPVINGPGPDITVIEMGDLDGYFVFVANEPTGPWYNITETGISIAGDGTTPGPGPENMPPEYGLPAEIYRFFGSGMFDLEGTGLENARYIAIVDDNVPDCYAEGDYSALISDATPVSINDLGPGADIDAIHIHHHSMSISYDDLSKDDDGDGKIDAYNKLIGSYDQPGRKVRDDDPDVVAIKNAMP